MPSFERAHDLRGAILAANICFASSIPIRASHIYVHLTDVCDVACYHCMYAADASARTRAKPRLRGARLDAALAAIADSHPTKLTISGGGEPFLEFQALLHTLRTAPSANLEIISAGRWARSPRQAATRLAALQTARAANPQEPSLLLRVSADAFHTSAPNPVALQDYANIVTAWEAIGAPYGLGLRGVLLEGDTTLRDLATLLRATLSSRDSWNAVLRLESGREVPVTYNVLRFSGGGEKYTQLRPKTRLMTDYYAPFMEAPGVLTLGRMVNDAINRTYTPDDGLAVTIDPDGTCFLFTASAPDWRCDTTGKRFDQIVAHFAKDPLTHYLLAFGVMKLTDVISRFAPEQVDRAIDSNDMTKTVSLLLATDEALAFASIDALQTLSQNGMLGSPQPSLIDALIQSPERIWQTTWGPCPSAAVRTSEERL